MFSPCSERILSRSLRAAGAEVDTLIVQVPEIDVIR